MRLIRGLMIYACIIVIAMVVGGDGFGWEELTVLQIVAILSAVVVTRPRRTYTEAHSAE